LALVAVVLSVLAPVLLRSIEQQTLADATGPVGGIKSTLLASADSSPGAIASGYEGAVDALSGASKALWTDPATVSAGTVAYPWGRVGIEDDTGTPPTVTLVSGGSTCAGARILAGKCPDAIGEVAVSQEAVRPANANTRGDQAGLTIGTRISLTIVDEQLPLTVVGVYDDRPLRGRFLSDPASIFRGARTSGDPAFVVADAQFDDRKLDGTGYAMRSLRHVLRLDDVSRVQRDVAHAHRATLDEIAAISDTDSASLLPALLDRLAPQHRAAEVLIALVLVEALALSWFAIALAVQRIARVRAPEWGLARLRGLPVRRRMSMMLLEPGIALAVGALVGFAVGTLAARVSVYVLVGHSTAVEPLRPLVFGAAVLALVGALVALVAASIRSARLPLTSVLRESTEPRRISRAALVAQSGAVLLTGAVVYSLFGQGTLDGLQLALLTPSLIAIVAGIVAVQVAIAVIRRASRRPPRSLGGIIIGRQLGRTPSILLTAVMVSLGLSVAMYSAQVAVTAIHLQENRAAASLGATTVLSVDVPHSVSFLDAVRRADPSGRSAMAVEVSTAGVGVGRFIAVDSSRLAAVSTVHPDWLGSSPAAVRSQLVPRHTEPLTARGTSLKLQVAGAEATKADTDPSTLELSAVVQAADGWHTVAFGTPHDGTLVSPAGSFPCSSGCRVAWIGVKSTLSIPSGFDYQMTITGVSTDRQNAAELNRWLDPGQWRDRIGDRTNAQKQSFVTLSQGVTGPAAKAGLRLDFTDLSGGNTVSAMPRDAPEPLPALIGSRTAVQEYPGVPNGVQGIAPDLSPRVLRVVGRAPALPRLLDNGALVDLETAGRISDTGSAAGRHEVWLAPGEHPQVVRVLTSEGIHVTATRHLSDVVTADVREASPRAALAGLPVGASALLLTLVAAAAIRLIGSAGRRSDWRSLLEAGVAPRRLGRLLILEAFTPVAAGIVLGVFSGLAAYGLTVSRLPLLTGDGVTPPAALTPAIVPVILLLGGSLLVAAGGAAVAAKLEVRATMRSPR
jgi:hypothetical protein